MLARRFLWGVAALIVLTIVGAFSYRFFERRFMETALVPTAKFTTKVGSGPDYRQGALWIDRPALSGTRISDWLPGGASAEAGKRRASVFFLHPTSYLDRQAWNAPIDHPDSARRAELFVRHQASAFNHIAEVWAPRYRQATFGAFLTSREDSIRALDFAYRDVAAAFDAFLGQADPRKPIILAAHSQGSLHLARLLRDKVAGTPLARRVVAAYVVGWPLSRTADIPAMGLPACEGPEDAGCILSWQSFAEPARMEAVTSVYEGSKGFTGAVRRQDDMLCNNPLTGTRDGTAQATANLGTLIPNVDLLDASIREGAVPARCERGFLLIGAPPALGSYVLPGNNYHLYDYALFWANIRADAARRLQRFEARR